MLNDFYAQPGILTRYQQGPLAKYFDQLVLAMENDGYARDTISISIRSVARFSCWLEKHNYTETDVSGELVNRYVSETERYASGKPKKCVQGLIHIVQLLHRQSACAAELRDVESTCIDSWLNRYDQHLSNVAGLQTSTRVVYLRNARYLLVTLFPDDDVDWTTVKAENLSNFVCEQAESRRGAGRGTPGVVVRSFIRFLAFAGEIDPAIAGGIPTVRKPTHAALPVRLCSSDVEQILHSVQQANLPEAKRDIAILTLLSQLGMRSCEIAALHLDDINWTEGQILVRPGKTHQERCLPLSQQVGDTLVDYIRHSRPGSTSRILFLRSCPPFTPFASAASIGDIAKRAMRRAKVKVQHGMGAHTFRHTVASQMVNQGATFKDVADVLGHRSLETTGIYAKLDLDSLLEVAMPWSGDAS